MKKKGFTLVELLAVIVILAIIALIATPMILNVIENAKKGASKSSALGYIEGIEKYIVLNEVTNKNSFNFEKGFGYKIEDIKNIIEIKGDKPTEGWVCIGDKKEVSKAELKINNYVIKYENNKAEVINEEIGTMDCTESEVNITVTYAEYKTGTIDEVSTIYYNPETATFCDETAYNNNSDKLGKTGCLKWYAIENSDSSKSTVNVILDHNTTPTVAWNSTGSNTSMNEVQTALTNDTTTWNGGLNVRLIIADEIAEITGNTTFDGTTAMFSNYFWFENNSNTAPETYSGKYSWLIDYTSVCKSYGCNIEDPSTYGYWTSTPDVNTTNAAWRVGSPGYLDNPGVFIIDGAGVRPVITIEKDKIK